ncbi:MAG: O-antigen ligase family protein [Patescibacteria group bacterium]|nr:O-antigen ligase family protein [Patescibacteria group bacterium]
MQKQSGLFIPIIIFLCFLSFGFINGILSNHGIQSVFLDINGYLLWGILGAAVTVINSKERIRRCLQLLFASVLAIGIKTIFLLFYFSHQSDQSLFRFVYTWVRDTRVGEIAPVIQNYYRIFFQGHMWQLLLIFLVILLLGIIGKRHLEKNAKKVLWATAIVASMTLLISFSRSIWLAFAVAAPLLLLYLHYKESISYRHLGKICLYMIGIGVINLLLITAIVNIRLPGGDSSGISAASLIQQRISTTDEAALKSRFQLLKPLVEKIGEKPLLGSGFAQIVRYQTLDPRTKNLNGGWYETYSFEWGYLDIAVKIGILGLLAYVWVIWKIFRKGIKILHISDNSEDRTITIALLFGIISLLVLHATTPYLNHPLGIFFLVITISILQTLSSGQFKGASVPLEN